MQEDQIPNRVTLQHECEQFLYHAAALLDDRRLNEWHELVTDDISYRVPIRTTRERASDTEFSDTSYHMKEDWDTLKVRTERMASDFAWSEDPPSRTRRQVSNVRITDSSDDEIELTNNLVIVQSRKSETEPDLLSMKRHETLRRDEDGYAPEWINGPGLKLAEREVLLDHTVIPTSSLSIIL
ncbi:small terminal subunit of phenylpropionate dioxygenase [Natrialba chahannaoensis JCM 10990]|uniref:Small terminal subunit of phenylpropionate dioxygenase n=1 Tax=Natrialba chahannaoensis JCM 10990 TaxID=1227492 RepID=M0B486_9EURY|nr:aromatic-ring-hydroxylating dioxygenase subunit beta [Natrialba chahannaoensis]ELZ05048.1 small terminal subunit of phenylpropionate dioxygenase [Natrialba chahannaoensis JCM 10990]